MDRIVPKELTEQIVVKNVFVIITAPVILYSEHVIVWQDGKERIVILRAKRDTLE